MKSIRRYLSVRIIWGAALILAAGSVLLGLAIRRLDIDEFDAVLEAKARTLATLVLREGPIIEVDFSGEYMPEFERTENPEYFQFRLRDGSGIKRSDLLGENNLPFLPNATHKPVFKNLRLPDGRRGRFVQISFPPRAKNGSNDSSYEEGFQVPSASEPAFVVLAVAQSREGLDAVLLHIYLMLVGMDILLVGLIALLVRRSVRMGFKPFADLNSQIAGLSPNSLEKRIHLPNAPIEIATFPAVVNGFIDALQVAFVRERRFISDVAHELRTPVTEFRAACDVGAKWSDDPALVKRRFENLRDSAANMCAMVNALLELSRLERDVVPAEFSETRVSTLVDEAWAMTTDPVKQPGIQMENRIPRSFVLNTDSVKLGMIVQNLLSNAASYSTPDSTIRCTGKPSSDGGWILCVSNPAPGLEPEDLPHVVERFWRKDMARTPEGHFGIGLSIVKSLATVLGIQVSFDLTPDSVFSVSLLFPPPRSY